MCVYVCGGVDGIVYGVSGVMVMVVWVGGDGVGCGCFIFQ